MKKNTVFAALRISLATFLMAHLAYALLTKLFFFGGDTVWLYSMAFALGGSGAIGLPVFFILVLHICSRSKRFSAGIFRQRIRTAAMLSAGLSALAVTIYCHCFLGPRESIGPLLFLPLAGILAPLPVLYLLRGFLNGIFKQRSSK